MEEEPSEVESVRAMQTHHVLMNAKSGTECNFKDGDGLSRLMPAYS